MNILCREISQIEYKPAVLPAPQFLTIITSAPR